MRALEYAIEVARKYKSTLYLLHVARVPLSDMNTPIAIEPDPHWQREARRSLELIAREQLEGRVVYEVIVRQGVPESVIGQAAAELPADLIVLSTHGRSGFAHLFLGSIAETVIDETQCPVLVVPIPDAERSSDDSQKS